MDAILALLESKGALEVYTYAIWIGYGLGLLTVPFILVQRRGRPVAALAWILAIFSLSWIGLLSWWLVGFNHLRRKRKWRKRSKARVKEALTELRDQLEVEAPAELPEALRANDYGVFPPTHGNTVELLVDGEQAYPRMLEAIEEARAHVHFCFYIWRKDEWGTRFRDALAAAAARGVQVRALYDDLGSASVDPRFLEPLLSAGGHCVSFLPNRILRGRWSVNFRNHRKILVADGRIGFTGGINIGDEYASDGWRDFMVRVDGPVVDQLQEVFADDWHFATGGESIADEHYFRGQSRAGGEALCNVVASGPDTESQETLDAFFIALNSADERVMLMTPYFVPDKTILITLRTLCVRGVDVTLILPGILDHRVVQWASRSYYHELLAFGVRIFEYQHHMLHGKAMVVDDHIAFVGSANLDHRSFRLNFEATLFVRDHAMNRALEAAFRDTLRDCHAVDPADYPAARGLRAVGEAMAQLASPLL